MKIATMPDHVTPGNIAGNAVGALVCSLRIAVELGR